MRWPGRTSTAKLSRFCPSRQLEFQKPQARMLKWKFRLWTSPTPKTWGIKQRPQQKLRARRSDKLHVQLAAQLSMPRRRIASTFFMSDRMGSLALPSTGEICKRESHAGTPVLDVAQIVQSRRLGLNPRQAPATGRCAVRLQFLARPATKKRVWVRGRVSGREKYCRTGGWIF